MSLIVKNLSDQVNTKKAGGRSYAMYALAFFAIIDEIIPGDGLYG